MVDGAFAQFAAHMLDGGYSPVPIAPEKKRPLSACAFYRSWGRLKRKALAPAQIEALTRKYPGLGLGVAGGFGGLVPIDVDVDVDEPEIIDAVRSALPEILVAKRGRKGFTAFYWNPGGNIEGRKFRRPREDGGFDMLVEVLTSGQSVVPPTLHPDLGRPYEWITRRTLFNEMVDELPIITRAHIDAMEAALRPWLPRLVLCPSPKVQNRPITSNRMENYARAALASEVQKLSALPCGRNWALYCAAAKLGKFVHGGILPEAEVASALMAATRANGYAAAKHGGAKQALATLRSGLAKAKSDPLLNAENRTKNRSSKHARS